VSGNSSATGGYLRQTDTPLTNNQWDDTITNAVVGITGLDPILVRPRWQPMPPGQPPAEVDWCAVGITSRPATDYPFIRMNDNGVGAVQTRWFSLNVLASFYGPNAVVLAGQLQDGLYIPQNLEQLAKSGIKLTEAGEPVVVPDLMHQQWIDRVDLPITFAAALDRSYDILSILSSEGTISTDVGVTAHWDTTTVIILNP
jgi:hypothetical protein